MGLMEWYVNNPHFTHHGWTGSSRLDCTIALQFICRQNQNSIFSRGNWKAVAIEILFPAYNGRCRRLLGTELATSANILTPKGSQFLLKKNRTNLLRSINKCWKRKSNLDIAIQKVVLREFFKKEGGGSVSVGIAPYLVDTLF